MPRFCNVNVKERQVVWYTKIDEELATYTRDIGMTAQCCALSIKYDCRRLIIVINASMRVNFERESSRTTSHI